MPDEAADVAVSDETEIVPAEETALDGAATDVTDDLREDGGDDAGTEGEGSPAEFDLGDEDLADIADWKGDQLVKTPAMQSRIQQEATALAQKMLAEQSTDPQRNDRYTELEGLIEKADENAVKALAQVGPMLDAMDRGEDVDPKQVARTTGAVIQSLLDKTSHIEERAGQESRVIWNGLLEEFLSDIQDEVVARQDDGSTLTIGQIFEHINRGADSVEGSAKAEKDPAKKAQILINGRKKFARQAADLLIRGGRVQGAEHGSKTTRQILTAQQRLAQKNGTTELQAQLAARRNGSTATMPGGRPPQNGDPALLAERVAYGQDRTGRAVTEADRAAFAKLHPG